MTRKRSKPVAKICVAVPIGEYIPPLAFAAFWAIASKGWALVPRENGRTDVNRNEIARLVLESDFTHVVMLDVDHLHPADIVERLARHVVADPSKLVVGGLHFRRGEPFEPCVFLYDDQGRRRVPGQWTPGIMRVDAIGHGSLLVSRRVFETIPGPWWQYDYSKWSLDEPVLPSEDMYFCRQCREYGIDIWCDTTITSPHLFTSAVTEETYRSWLAANREQLKRIEE